MPRRSSAALLVALLAAAAVAQPPPPSADEQKAAELFRAGKLEQAFAALKDAAKANPQLPPAKVMLAEMLFKSNNAQRGRLLLEPRPLRLDAPVPLLPRHWRLARGRRRRGRGLHAEPADAIRLRRHRVRRRTDDRQGPRGSSRRLTPRSERRLQER